MAGFQTLLDTVRDIGVTNIVMIGGLAYSNDLSQWLTYRPKEPLNNVMAFAHIYNVNTCSSTSCYDSTFAPVAKQVPLALTEIGENDCGHEFIDPAMSWADSHGVGYLGWTWNTWDCSDGPALIGDYDHTPTPFGEGAKVHLATVSNWLRATGWYPRARGDTSRCREAGTGRSRQVSLRPGRQRMPRWPWQPGHRPPGDGCPAAPGPGPCPGAAPGARRSSR